MFLYLQIVLFQVMFVSSDLRREDVGLTFPGGTMMILLVAANHLFGGDAGAMTTILRLPANVHHSVEVRKLYQGKEETTLSLANISHTMSCHVMTTLNPCKLVLKRQVFCHSRCKYT